MIQAMTCAVLLCGLIGAKADTIHVTVGDTGCIGRQNSVKGFWEKIPGVVSVTVIPRQPKDQAVQRVFVIVSKAASPTEDSLREALRSPGGSQSDKGLCSFDPLGRSFYGSVNSVSNNLNIIQSYGRAA